MTDTPTDRDLGEIIRKAVELVPDDEYIDEIIGSNSLDVSRGPIQLGTFECIIQTWKLDSGPDSAPYGEALLVRRYAVGHGPKLHLMSWERKPLWSEPPLHP